MEVKKRQSYPLGMFDLVKGLGMIGIVLFHTLSFADISPWVSSVVHVFTGILMPGFFAFSGFQFRPASGRDAVKKYAKTSLPIYFRLAASLWLILLIFKRDSLLMYVLAFLLGTFYERRVGPIHVGGINSAWFLLGLFWGSILLNLVLKIRKDYLRLICILGLSTLGYLLGEAQMDYLCLYRGFSALPAMYVGYYVYSEDLLARNASDWSRSLTCLLVILTVPVILLFEKLSILWLSVLWPVSEMIWGYAAICLSRDTVRYTNTILEWVRKIGRYTPWIIIVHCIDMICFPWNRLTNILWFIPNGDILFLILILIRGSLILIGCVIIGRFDRLAKRWKRERRRKKREQMKMKG